MSFGLQCFNDSGELTLSSDGMLLGYLGKATFVSTTAAGTSPADSTNGYSTYTFNYGGPIVVGIGLVTSGSSNGSYVEGYSNSGSTWTITVFHSNTTQNAIGFEGQLASAEVYVWGVPLSVSGFGMALYDASGNLTADLSKRPLTFIQRVTMTGSTLSTPMPTVTKPVMIGSPCIARQTSAPSGPSFINRYYNGAWYWNTATGNLERAYRQREYLIDDAGTPTIVTSVTVNALLVEGNGLT